MSPPSLVTSIPGHLCPKSPPSLITSIPGHCPPSEHSGLWTQAEGDTAPAPWPPPHPCHALPSPQLRPHGKGAHGPAVTPRAELRAPTQPREALPWLAEAAAPGQRQKWFLPAPAGSCTWELPGSADVGGSGWGRGGTGAAGAGSAEQPAAPLARHHPADLSFPFSTFPSTSGAPLWAPGRGPVHWFLGSTHLPSQAGGAQCSSQNEDPCGDGDAGASCPKVG